MQVYVVEDQKAKQIAVVAAPQTHYQGKQIFDVDFETLYQYLDSDERALRERDYRDGELLRACDWRIFRLENQRANHIGTLTELRDKYEGQIIYNVDYWILKRYLEPDPVKLKQLLFTLGCLPGLLRLKPDIIYPTDSGWQALICSIFARLTGAKLVITGHSGPGWDDRWNLLIKPHLFIAFTHHQLRWAKKTTLWRQWFCFVH